MENFYIVALGASAGGQQSLIQFLQHLPERPGAAFVVITHLLREHSSMLHEILARHTTMKVIRLRDQEVVQPNVVYVMPENVKAYIRGGVILLKERVASERINNSIDTFFESLANDQQMRAIGIVFSGMGSDGAEGAETIHEHGGTILVQHPASTNFKSMPQAVIENDHPLEILPPAALAQKVSELIQEQVVNHREA